jgi:hypothetical protein
MKTFDTAVRSHSQLTSYATMQRILENPNVLYLKTKKPNDTPVTNNAAEQTLIKTKAMKNAIEGAIEGVLTTVQFLEGERDHTPRELKKAEKNIKEKPASSSTASNKNEKVSWN